MSVDVTKALVRSLEREERLLNSLKEVIFSIDESAIGPISRILPRWQMEKISDIIRISEEEMEVMNQLDWEVEENG